MNISTQNNNSRANNNNTLNYLNEKSEEILAQIGEVGEKCDDKRNSLVSGALQTASDKLGSFWDVKDIVDNETGDTSLAKKSLRRVMGVFDAVTGVLEVASVLNKDIKNGDKTYSNTMFAITKSVLQTVSTTAGATAAVTMLAGAISGGAILAAGVVAGAAAGYLVGRCCDRARQLV